MDGEQRNENEWREYTLRWDRVILFLAWPAAVIISGGVYINYVKDLPHKMNDTIGALLAAFLLLMFAGMPLGLLINYYLYCKDKILKISVEGNDFYYGEESCPHCYSKSQISKIYRCETNNFRNPWNGYTVFKICFRDGTSIRFPNLLISDTKLSEGLGVETERKSTWYPYITRDGGNGK
jgi:hypothetical protein